VLGEHGPDLSSVSEFLARLIQGLAKRAFE
jgi:hypothetical protein